MSFKEVASIVTDRDGNFYVYEVTCTANGRKGPAREAKGVLEIVSTAREAIWWVRALLDKDAERLRGLILDQCDERYFGPLREGGKRFAVVANEHFKDDASHLPPRLLTDGVSLVSLGNSNFPVVVR